MAITNFPDNLYVMPVDTSTERYLGIISPTESSEFGHLILHLVKVGAHAGTEEWTIKLYSNANAEGTAITSETFSIADIDSITSSDWIGEVRMDFGRENFVAGVSYYAYLDPVTYTRNADTFYLAPMLDWPITINTQSSTQEVSAKMEFWSYK